MALTTSTDGIEYAKRLLYSSHREELNTLSGAHNSSTTTFTFTNELGGIQAGVRLSVNLEVVHVTAVNAAAKTATVIRGVDGSTAAAHSSGDVVTVKPIFTNFEILEAANADLLEVSGRDIFRVGTVELTAGANAKGYNLTSVTDPIDIIQVKWKEQGVTRGWTPVARHLMDFDASANTTDFASGFALTIRGDVPSGRTIRVWYKRPLGTFTALAQNIVTQTGLPSFGVELPWVGAAKRLVVGREVSRNFFERQGDTRRADEVQAGANVNAFRELERRYEALYGRVADGLARQYPVA